MRILRHKRKDTLKRNGFLPFEAQSLSTVPRKTPYLSQMMATRASLRAKAKREGWTQARYEKYIKDQYQKKGWHKTNRAGKIVSDVWAMLRDYADRYKATHPEYTSPWKKRQKRWRNFASKYDEGKQSLEKYDRGRYR